MRWLGVVAFWAGTIWNVFDTGGYGAGPVLLAMLGPVLWVVAAALQHVIYGWRPPSAARQDHDLHRLDSARE